MSSDFTLFPVTPQIFEPTKGQFRILHNKKLHDLNTSPSIAVTVKYRLNGLNL